MTSTLASRGAAKYHGEVTCYPVTKLRSERNWKEPHYKSDVPSDPGMSHGLESS